jgi:PEP-CTERM motif
LHLGSFISQKGNAMRNVGSKVKAAISLIASTMAFAANAGIIVDGTLYRTGGLPLGAAAAWYSGTDNAVQTTVGIHRFTVNSPGSVTFDILSWEGAGGSSTSPPTDINGDGEIAFFDAHIRLYNALTNALVMANDDSDATFGDGSIYNRDAFMSANLAAGDYFLAVGSFDFNDADALSGSAFGTGPITWNGASYVVADHGDYRLTVTGDVSEIPEPGAMALAGLVLAGVGLARRSTLKRQRAVNSALA